MASFKLTSTGDLDFSSGGLEFVTGAEEIGQKIAARLKFFLGEWILDTRLGADHYGITFSKGVSDIERRTLFRQIVAKTPGVDSLLSFTFRLNSATREFTATFKAKVVGVDVPVDFSIPFIIEV